MGKSSPVIFLFFTLLAIYISYSRFLLGLPKESPSLKMPFVIFVLVFYLQSQIAVWALIRMRMIREHRFLPPLEGIFCPYCCHCLQKGLTNQNPLSEHTFKDLREPRPKGVFCPRGQSQFSVFVAAWAGHFFSRQFSRFPKENTLFRNDKSKEEVLRYTQKFR